MTNIWNFISVFDSGQILLCNLYEMLRVRMLCMNNEPSFPINTNNNYHQSLEPIDNSNIITHYLLTSANTLLSKLCMVEFNRVLPKCIWVQWKMAKSQSCEITYGTPYVVQYMPLTHIWLNESQSTHVDLEGTAGVTG